MLVAIYVMLLMAIFKLKEMASHAQFCCLVCRVLVLVATRLRVKEEATGIVKGFFRDLNRSTRNRFLDP